MHRGEFVMYLVNAPEMQHHPRITEIVLSGMHATARKGGQESSTRVLGTKVESSSKRAQLNPRIKSRKWTAILRVNPYVSCDSAFLCCKEICEVDTRCVLGEIHLQQSRMPRGNTAGDKNAPVERQTRGPACQAMGVRE